ncbi:hypothetical protein V2I01_31500 [Micromonospora sp. BRA006-A]|nr:hypothetical protein [Micromonospora sp. BRA006-A]
MFSQVDRDRGQAVGPGRGTAEDHRRSGLPQDTAAFAFVGAGRQRYERRPGRRAPSIPTTASSVGVPSTATAVAP